MLFKILGGTVIIICTTIIGFERAARLERRKRSLEEFIASLTMLESEICYLSNPLQTAFASIGSAFDSYVGRFLTDFSQMLHTDEYDISKCWADTLEGHCKAMCLDSTDIEHITSFAVRLGKTDKDGQIKNITHHKARAEVQLAQANEVCGKNKKMYQSFGMLAGILIVILLG